MLDKAKERWARLREWVASLPVARNRMVILGWRVVQEMGHDDATHLAAGVAYYALFSLFPLALGLLALAGILLQTEETQQQFIDFAREYLPGSSQIITDNLRNVVNFRGVLGLGAIAGLLWSASAVFGAINRAVNRAWDVHKDRPFYIAKPRQIVMALAVGVLFALSALMTSFITVVTTHDLGIPGQGLLRDLGLGQLALRAVPWVITLSVFLLIYKFVPNTKTYWRHIWPGAVTAAVLFEVAKSLFVWYLNSFASYDRVYGPLASVIVLLFWAYLSSMILIVGAEICSEWERLHAPAPAVEEQDEIEF